MLKVVHDHLMLSLNEEKFEGEVLGGFGTFTITQTYVNHNSQAVAAHYISPMPEDAFLLRFHAQTGDKKINTTVLETEEAEAFAQKAKQEGIPQDILQLDQWGTLSVNIGQIESGNSLTVTVVYLQKLKAARGETRIVIPSLAERADCKKVLIKYAPSNNIESIHSPNHLVKTEVYQNTAYITMEDEKQEGEIVLSVIEKAPNKPIVYYNNRYCCWQFTPRVEANHNEENKEYIFLIDCSSSMAGDKLKQARDALSVCLCGLTEQDKFNIIAFENRCHYFSLKSLPFHQSNLDSAIRWLAQLKPMGDATLNEALRHAYEDNHKNRIIYLVTDGHITSAAETVQFTAQQQKGNLYILCTNYLSDIACMNQIARAADGVADYLQMGQRIDQAIIAHFYRARALGIKDAKITPQGGITELSPVILAKLCGGDRVLASAKRMDEVPTAINLSGRQNDQEYHEEIHFDACETSLDLEALYIQIRLRALLLQLSSFGSPTDKLTMREIKNLSLKWNILTPYTALAMRLHFTDSNGIAMDRIIPAHFTKIHFPRQDENRPVLSLMKKQNADGSFGEGGMQESADALMTLFHEETELMPYCKHIEKGIVYLFQFIQSGDYDVLPKEVIKAFDIWCKHLAEKTLFAKKVEAIVLMNRDLLQ